MASCRGIKKDQKITCTPKLKHTPKSYVRIQMALVYTENHPKFGSMVLWAVTEEASFFRNELDQTALEMDYINSWHENRQLEWMSARYLIHKYAGIDLSQLYSDALGKVHIHDSATQISISHSEELVGVQYHSLAVGLDIQIKTDKIHRVASKFCSTRDYQILEQFYSKKEAELITWSMKESVFKAYGRGKVRYKEEIAIVGFIDENRHKVLLQLSKTDGFHQKYEGRIRFIGDYCITQIIERN